MEDAKKFYQIGESTRELDNHFMHEKIGKTQFESILEIGCGNGEMLKQYPMKSALGVDINPSMVEYAKSQGNNVILEDITQTQSEFSRQNQQKLNIICANYVFTELKQNQLKKAFENISNLLSQKGKFYFTITNPTIRSRNDLPDYKVVFEKEFNYQKEDIPFTVLLEDKLSGEFVDVGIRDFHNPTEVYTTMLEKYFSKIKIHEIKREREYAHALLFEASK